MGTIREWRNEVRFGNPNPTIGEAQQVLAAEKAARGESDNTLKSLANMVANAVSNTIKTGVRESQKIKDQGYNPYATDRSIAGQVANAVGDSLNNAMRYTKAIQSGEIKPLNGGTEETRAIAQRDRENDEWLRQNQLLPNYSESIEDALHNTMSASQKAIYNNLYNNYGKEEAEKFFKTERPELTRKFTESQKKYWSETGEKDPVGTSIVSVASNMAKPMEYLYRLAQKATTGKIDENDPMGNLGTNMTNYGREGAGRAASEALPRLFEDMADRMYQSQPNLRQAVKNEVQKNKQGIGNVANFLYNTGMSMADFLVAAGITKGVNEATAGMSTVAQKLGEFVSLTPMGLQAAQDATIHGIERGLTEDQAVVEGMIAGVLEQATEMFSVEALLNPSKALMKGNKLGYVLKNALAEGSEEVASDIGNWIADKIISGDKSELKERMKELRFEHPEWSEAQAWWTAQSEQILPDFLGGAISGGIMGGVGAEFNSYNNTKMLDDFANTKGVDYRNVENLTPMIEMALENDSTSTSHQIAETLQNKMENGQALTDDDIGGLMNAINEEEIDENRPAFKQEIKDFFANRALERDIREYEKAQEEYANREISPEEASLFEENPVTFANNGRLLNPMDSMRNEIVRDNEGNLTSLIGQDLRDNLATRQSVADMERLAVDELRAKYGGNPATNTVAALTADMPKQEQYVMNEFYDGKTDPYEYVSAMRDARIAGLSGQDINTVQGNLNEAQRQAAYELGRSDLDELRLRQSGKWSDGENPGGQVRTMEQSTGFEKNFKGNADTELSSVDLEQNDAVEVTFDDERGKTRKMSYVPVTNIETEKMKAAKDVASKVGYEIIFTNGLQEHDNGMLSRGMVDTENKKMYVQVNHPVFNAEQIAKHEEMHERIAKGEVDVSDVLLRITNRLGQKKVREMLDDYRDAYDGADMSDEYVIEEIICDANGGINVFAGARDIMARVFAPQLEVVKSETKKSMDNLPHAPPQDKRQLRLSQETKFKEELDRVSIEEDNTRKFSVETYLNKQGNLESGREVLAKYLGIKDLSKADQNAIIKHLDWAVTVANDMAKDYEYLGRWNDTGLIIAPDGTPLMSVRGAGGAPLRSVVVTNGDYPLNVDFTTVCKKRMALDAVLNRLVTDPKINLGLLSEADIAEINRIIKEKGFEIACGLCYVDAKRYRVSQMANTFVNGQDKTKGTKDNKKTVHTYGWNELVQSMLKKGVSASYFELASDHVTPLGTLLSDVDDKDIDFSLLDKIIKPYLKKNGKIGQATINGKKSNPTEEVKWAYQLRNDPSSRHLIDANDLISSEGLDALKAENSEVYKLATTHGAQAAPKASSGFTAYGNEIIHSEEWAKSNKDAKDFNKKDAYKVGGVRVQSFSDYVANMFFDYMQMFADMSARQLPSHAYTKEANYVRLFGQTGQRINMSLIFKGAELTKEQAKRLAALKKKGQEFIDNDPFFKELKERAGLDKDGNYLYEDESFDPKIAYALRKDPRYKNCGTIAVGLSDAHIRKLLADPNIDMVIPYHASGVSQIIKNARGLVLYTDYTGSQNTRKGKTKLKGNKDFDWYGHLKSADNMKGLEAKECADAYLKWCDKNGYTPKFDQFRDDENYYKLIVDFRSYDNDGNFMPQGAVSLDFLDDEKNKKEFTETVRKSLEEHQDKYAGRIDVELSDEQKSMYTEIKKALEERGVVSESKVKMSAEPKFDSEGNELSKGQQEYFKDSKVRDDKGNLLVMYHGSENAGHTVFLPGTDTKAIFLTDSMNVAKGYSGTRSLVNLPTFKSVDDFVKYANDLGEYGIGYKDNVDVKKEGAEYVLYIDGGEEARAENFNDLLKDYLQYRGEIGSAVYQTYVNITNPLRIDAKGNYWDEINLDFSDELKSVSKDQIQGKLVEYAKKNGYDGIIIDDVYDIGLYNSKSEMESSTVAMAFDSSQVKLTSNENPTTNKDIRFSEESKELAKERKRNEQLEKKLLAAYDELDRYKSTSLLGDRHDAERIAKDLLQRFSSDMSQKDLARAIADLGTYVLNESRNKKLSGEEYLSQLKQKAVDIAMDIVKNSNEMTDKSDYNDIRKLLEKGIRISPSDRRNISGTISNVTIANNGVDIDEVYSKLSEKFPWYFPSDIKDAADQIMQIDDVIGEIRPYYENSFEKYGYTLSDIVESVANDIISETAFGQIQAEETYRVKMDKFKQKKAEEIKNVKESYKEREKKGRERREAKELREKIARHTQKLSKKLLEPSKTSHITERDDLGSLKTTTAKVLSLINQESTFNVTEPGSLKHAKEGGFPTKKTIAWQRLKSEYEKIAEAGNFITDEALTGKGGWIDQIAQFAETPIGKLNVEDLQKIYNTLLSLEATLTMSDKTFAAIKGKKISEIVYSLLDENMEKKAHKVYGIGKKNGADALDFLNDVSVEMLDAHSFFHRLGNTGDQLFRALRDSQDNSFRFYQQAKAWIDENIDVDIDKAGKVNVKVTLGGKEQEMSLGSLMELYLLSKRKQGLNHILGGGINLLESSKKNGLITLDPSKHDITDITKDELETAFLKLGSAFPEYKKVADDMQKFMSTTAAKYGNDASMRVYGYEKFPEENYWRIRVDRNHLNSNIENYQNNVTTVGNKGMSKSVNPDATQPIYIGNAFETFLDQLVDMSDYGSYLEVTEDMNRILNYKSKDANTKAIIQNALGTKGERYWLDLMRDVSNAGVAMNSLFGGAANRGLGYFKAGAVGGNLRVIVQQPTAILRAMDMIDGKYLAMGINHPFKGMEKAMKYAPIAWWKDQGYYNLNNGRTLWEMIYDDPSKLKKASEFLMAGAGKADNFAWGILWNAVEAETKAKTDLKVGSEEYYEHCGKRFSEIIDNSQVVDGVLQRAGVMRKTDIFSKMTTAFMGEPIKQLNQFLNAWYDYRNGNGSKALVAKTAKAMISAAILNAVVKSLVDAMRHSERDKKYWDKFAEEFWGLKGDEKTPGEVITSAVLNGFIGGEGNAYEIFDIPQYIPLLRDLESLYRGYDVERSDLSVIGSIKKARENLIKAYTGEAKDTTFSALSTFLGEVSKLAGVPIGNVMRDVYSGFNAGFNEVGSDYAVYQWNKLFFNIDAQDSKGTKKNKTRYMDLAYKAWADGHDEEFKLIYEDMKNHFTTKEFQNYWNKKMAEEQGLEGNTKELEGKVDFKKGDIGKHPTISEEKKAENLKATAEKKEAQEKKEEHQELIEDLYELWVNNDPSFESTYNELKDEIDSDEFQKYWDDTMKEEQGVNNVNNLEGRVNFARGRIGKHTTISAQKKAENQKAAEEAEAKSEARKEAEAGLNDNPTYKQIQKSSIWSQATSGMKKDTEDTIVKLKAGTDASTQEHIDIAKRHGISESDWLLYHLAWQIVDQSGYSGGKVGKADNKERTKAASMVGLTLAQINAVNKEYNAAHKNK